MRRLAALVALALVAGALPALGAPKPIPPGQAKKLCSDNDPGVKDLVLPVAGESATGRYALPEDEPDTLILFAHGYGHHSASWIEHMRRAAADHGALAVAMDYRGTYEQRLPDGTVIVRGWFVKEGAADMIAAARFFESVCPSLRRTVLFGVSMGGNSSGLALAGAAKERDARGGPLFDYWFDVEGAVNVLETYAGASALAPVNGFAANAKADIEDEMNGTPAQDPAGYADLAVVTHIDEIAASGVQGVAVIHALEDGLVPYNQAREIVPLLVGAGIPTEMYTIAGKGDGESGTTITGYTPYKGSPFAGHASERSTTHLVMVTAFERLWSLVDRDTGFTGYTENLVEGV